MIAALLGVAVGLVLGLTGAGGSILAVPLLMWGLGWTVPQAAPVALLAVCAAATFGTVSAWDITYVRWRAAMLMAVAGLLTAPFGLKAAEALPIHWLTMFFAVVLAAVAVRMIRQARRAPEEAAIVRAAVAGDGTRARGPICRLNPKTGRLVWTLPCRLVLTGIGTVTGFLAGLLGVGGGFVIVPALRTVSELSMHSAVATSLMAIALTSAGTVVTAVLQGRELPWEVALPFAVGALVGMSAGRYLAPRITGPRLQQGFAALMVAVALVMVVHAARVL